MTLTRYQAIRSFDRTPEPSGKSRKINEPYLYVVQKHNASHLHFDFRLELDGVLKSWAVPKGPSSKAGEKRLAVEVEDHPIEYAFFEGVIPEGQYGAGLVKIWDSGTWEPLENAKKGLKNGKLHFRLHGKKLEGRWTLLRMNAPSSKKNMWLLVKSKDAIKKTRPKAALIEPHEEKEIILTHPDKLYFPDILVSKAKLVEYYQRHIDLIEQHFLDRPVSLLRCPEGVNQPCFYQKHPDTLPTNVGQVLIQEKEKQRYHIMIQNKMALFTLVQYGTLEFHTWGCKADDLDHPDRMVFDLDPGAKVDFQKVIDCAKKIHEALTALKLESFVKTSGKKGLHVFVPLAPVHSWKKVKLFSQKMADEIVQTNPKDFSITPNKSKRTQKVFIDCLRNEKSATCVAAYSTRATPHAGISMPLSWDALSTLPRADFYDWKNLEEHLQKRTSDPWAEYFTIQQKLPSF